MYAGGSRKDRTMSKMTLIAGPCVIESEQNVMLVAETVAGIARKLDLDYYFKASFDKANRTSISSYRGPGIEKGLEILQKVKDTLGLKICTDIHEPWQAERRRRWRTCFRSPLSSAGRRICWWRRRRRKSASM